ncbi:hypothetical protein ACHQM5_010288 [Ranunculus cassubicifolius]
MANILGVSFLLLMATPIVFGHFPEHQISRRHLQQASSPSHGKDSNDDDTLLQPAAGGSHHGGNDLKSWDKLHPKPPS